jgi:membrane associated rhomboid family serine protease
VIIPLSTDLRLPRTPIVTRALVALNVGVFLGLFGVARFDPEQADRIVALGSVWGDHFHWWNLFTSAFLHGGWIHLAGNMIFLWVFGPSVEQRYGRLGFLAFYLAGAAFSGGAHAIFDAHPAIGASGAIAAVTGAFIVLFPQTLIRCLWLFGLAVIHAPAWWVIGLGILWNLLAGSIGADTGVAHVAHHPGYAFGVGLTMALLAAGVFPREPYDLFTAIRQARRRRELRAVTAPDRGPTKPERAAHARESHRHAAIVEARAEVSRLMSLRDLPAASDAYRDMVAAHKSASPALLTLPRATQYELAIHLYGQGRLAEAADAFTRLLDVYPRDPEADHIRVLLARAYARRLDRPAEAVALLERVVEHGADDDLRALAERELAAITG